MRIWFFGLIIIQSLFGQAQDFFGDADLFFQKYVRDGKVKYAALKQNPVAMDALVEQIAEMNLSNKRVTPSFLKAFYINAYNILVIREVVDHYPVEGPLKIPGFFDKVTHSVMGQTMTLDQLEKETLYAQFPDPRLHFVLVCAAKGCPPLAGYSYKPDQLENQLEERTRFILNHLGFVQVVKDEVRLSQIFVWYEKDFTSKGTLLSYINTYRAQPLDPKWKLSFYIYDWTLNE